jgi:peptidoglycan/LPS O-acetylase OafA/YrhL
MKQQRFVALDSLRGICAVMVAIYHFSTTSLLSNIPFIENGYIFVDFFFVLSGFVIASSYGERLRSGFPISRFMFLRLGRLYPLHVFVLCLYLPIAIGGAYSASSFWITALLLQVFTDGQLGNWNPPSWSISAEVWTYLIFALSCRFAGRYLQWMLGLLIVAALPVLLWTTDRYLNVCFEGGLARCLFGFSMGAIAFFYWSKRDKPSLSSLNFTLIELGVVAACLIVVSIAAAGPLSFLCPPVFVAAILTFAHERGYISSILKSSALKAVGMLSYSIYMTHMFVQARLLNLIGLLSAHVWLPISKEGAGTQTISSNIPLVTDLTVVLMVAVVIGFAYLTFSLIEEPFRRWSRDSYVLRPREEVNP